MNNIPDDLLTNLRRLLGANEPSPQRWDELILRLEQCDDPNLLTSIALPYCEEHLARWPDSLRIWPSWWFDLGESIAENPPSPLIALIRHIDDPAPSLDAIHRLSTTPLLSQITTWITDPYPYRANIALSLAQNQHLIHLKRIELRQVAVADEGAIALATAPHLAQLQILRLDECGVGPSGAQALAQSHLKDLRSLSLKGFHQDTDRFITPENIAALLALPNLTTLDLSGHTLKGLSATLKPSDGHAHLRSLALMWCTLGPPDASALTETLAASLSILNLSTNPLGDQAVRNLTQRPWPHLTALDLAQTQLTAACIDDLTHLTRGLSHLSLAENPLGDDVSRLFTTTPHTLYSLKLNDIQCTDALTHTLAERPESTALRTLDLSGNAITDEGAKKLAQSPHLTHLTSLRLLHCPLTDVGRNALAHSSVLQGCAIWIDEGTSVHPLWGEGL